MMVNHRNHTWMSLFFLLALALAFGGCKISAGDDDDCDDDCPDIDDDLDDDECNDDGSDDDVNDDVDDDNDDDDDTVPTGPGGVKGRVLEVDNEPVQNAEITFDFDPPVSVETDADGLFEIGELDPADGIIAKVECEGFVATYKILDVLPGSETLLLVTMKRKGASFAFDPSLPLDYQADGHRVVLGANQLLGANGQPVQGEVEMTLTVLDPTTNDLRAYPGNMDFEDLEGYTGLLYTAGVFYLEFTQGGQELEISTDTTFDRIEISISDDLQVEDGQTVPLWSFDPESGRWIEIDNEATFDVPEPGSKLGTITVLIEVWEWNDNPCNMDWVLTFYEEVDVPVPGAFCFNGYLYDTNGNPLIGTVIKVTGVNYNYERTSYVQENGYFCADMGAGPSLTSYLEFFWGGAYAPWNFGINITPPDIGATCAVNTEECFFIGDLHFPDPSWF